MKELSLNILDIVQNSIRAKSTLIKISINIDTDKNSLLIVISDNGQGISKEDLFKVNDPFFTTRTSRKVGLGIPLLKQSAAQSGGYLDIKSDLGIGTTITAEFELNNIDRTPLGDINSTIYLLVISNTEIDIVYTYKINEKSFVLDTKEIKEIVGQNNMNTKEVTNFIKDFLEQNKSDIDQGMIF